MNTKIHFSLGFQYEAYIYGIDRQTGFLILRVDELRLEGGLFNVSFLVQEKLLGPHSRAVLDISKLLTESSENIDSDNPGAVNRSQPLQSPTESAPPQNNLTETPGYTRKMLFPEKSDGVLQTGLNKGVFTRSWFDRELNYEQQVRALFITSCSLLKMFLESCRQHTGAKLWYCTLPHLWSTWNWENKDYR